MQDVLSTKVRSAIGNGLNTLFWLDRWILEEQLINFVVYEINLVDKFKCVREHWDMNSGWQWDKLNGGAFRSSV